MIKPPKPLRLDRRRLHRGFMTIAAGFQFNGGVLLCADSQYSGRSIKFFDSKLKELTQHSRDGDEQFRSVIAVSGTDCYLDMAVSACENAMLKVIDADAVDIGEPDAIRTALSDALCEFHQKQIFKHPHYGYSDGPSVTLLIAVRVDGNATIFRTQETAVTEISFFDPCVFIGSGSEVARYAVTPLIKPDAYNEGLTLDEAVLLGTHALRIAKHYDPYCGGWSQFAVLSDDGSASDVARREIDSGEVYSKAFEEILQRLFYSAAQLDGEEGLHNEDELWRLSVKLRELRDVQRSSISARRNLTEELKRARAFKPSTPQK